MTEVERARERPNEFGRSLAARDAFLGCFNPRHRQEVIEFGKRLRAVEADYLLFMARKAVCFYECLAALKLTELRGVLLSDRILDLDLNWLEGKKVAIVDDAVIYGTTLAKAASALRNAGATVSDIIVFCANSSSWQPERVSPSEPFLRMDEKETAGFCADLVRAISVLPMPYAVDYPLVRRLRIGDDHLEQAFAIPGWDTRAHTTPLQFSTGVSTHVCTPTRSKRAEIFPLAESALAKICNLAKIRLYGRHLNKHSATWFTVMPVAVLEPLLLQHIDELWSCVLLVATENESAILKSLFVSPTSKLRAIQFVLGARLARHWIADLRMTLNLKVLPRIDVSYAGFSFSPQAAQIICAIAVREPAFSEAAGLSSASGSMLRIEHPLDTFEPNAWSLQAALIKPFLDLHTQKEKPARQQRFAIDDLPDAVKNRLNEGFSLRQLRQSITALSGQLAPESVLSEFLDHAIDRGFVVPISTIHNGVAFRAYRYGEDIQDAEQFRQLCARCINSFLDASGALGITRSWVEKLLVLLLQGLLSQRLIDPTDLAMGSSGTLGVRYALHGAVLKEQSTRIYSHYDGDFYVDVLQKYGYVRRAESAEAQSELPVIEPQETKDRTRRYIGVVSRDPIPEDPAAVESAEGLGLLVGFLASRPSSSFALKDLILLATCYSPASTAAALAAELDIFQNDWRFAERQIQQSADLVPASNLRESNWFLALNSARFKYSDYLNDSVDSRLNTLESDLSAAPDREAKFVLSSLRAFRRNRMSRQAYSQSDPRHLLLLELGKLLYELNILARLLLLEQRGTGDVIWSGNAVKEMEDLVAEHTSLLARATSAPQSEHNLSRLVLLATSRASQAGVDFLAIRKWAIGELRQRAADATEYLIRVDHVVARVGLPNNYYLFPHALVLEITGNSLSQRWGEALSDILKRAIRDFNARSSQGRAYAQQFSPPAPGASVVLAGIAFRGDSARGLLELVTERIIGEHRRCPFKRLLSFIDIDRSEQPLKSECASQFVAQLFWERTRACLNDLTLATPGYYQLRQFEDRFQFDFESNVDQIPSVDVVTVLQPTPKSYQVDQRTPMQTELPKVVSKRRANMQRADIGIICVTDSELNAIRSAMSKMPQFLEEERFTYYSAQFDGNDCKHRVVMTYSTDQGNVSAAISVAKFLTKYRPRLMVMVGMAGGISDELKLLDVAISTEIIYYEPRKERDSAVSSRLQVMPISTKLRRVVRSFKADLGAPASVLDYIDDEVAHSFRIYDGPFGTGEAIVGSKNSAARATVLNCNDKALVVETEAWGVHKAVFEDEDCKGKCRYALTIKGVADNADSEKDESRQYRASRNAFETLRALLSTLKSADLL